MRLSNQVACPKCGSSQGYDCVLVSFSRLRTKAKRNHPERQEVYRNHYGPLPWDTDAKTS